MDVAVHTYLLFVLLVTSWVHAQRLPPPSTSTYTEGSMDAKYNCFSREVWTAEKKEFCCRTRNLGCPTAVTNVSTTQADQKDGRYVVAYPAVQEGTAPQALPMESTTIYTPPTTITRLAPEETTTVVSPSSSFDTKGPPPPTSTTTAIIAAPAEASTDTTICCQAMTLSCMACKEGLEARTYCNIPGKRFYIPDEVAKECSVYYNCSTRELRNPQKQAYCSKTPAPIAVPVPDQLEEKEDTVTVESRLAEYEAQHGSSSEDKGSACCEAMSLGCLACQDGVSMSSYCNRPAAPLPSVVEKDCEAYFNCRTREMYNPAKQAYCTAQRSPPEAPKIDAGSLPFDFSGPNPSNPIVIVKEDPVDKDEDGDGDTQGDTSNKKNMGTKKNGGKKRGGGKKAAAKRPLLLTLNKATSSTLTLVWAMPPAAKCGSNYGINVYSTEKGTSKQLVDAPTPVVSAVVGSTYYTAKGLDPDTEYHIKVGLFGEADKSMAEGVFKTTS